MGWVGGEGHIGVGGVGRVTLGWGDGALGLGPGRFAVLQESPTEKAPWKRNEISYLRKCVLVVWYADGVLHFC